LYVSGSPYRACEVEFYFRNDTHNDIFTHCDDLQKLNCRWYFHKNGSKYKSGSYKGLDVTFGQDNKGFGGILIRSIAKLDGDGYISGPCLVVNHILQQCGASSIDDLVVRKSWSEYGDHEGSLLYFKEQPDLLKSVPVYQSARIGLTLKQYTDEKAEFVMQNYRYVTFPDKNKKGKNHLAVSLFHEGKKSNEITKITKSTNKTVDNWTKHYTDGKKNDPDHYKNNALKKVQDVNELYGACSKFLY